MPRPSPRVLPPTHELVDLDMIPRLATDPVATGSDHAGAEFGRIWNAVS